MGPRGENLDMGTTASALPAITATATSFVMTATAAIFVPKSKKETTHPNFINWVLVEGLEREIYSCPGHYERLGDFFTAFGCNVSNVDIELQADGTMTTGTAWVVLSDDESVSKAVALDGIEDDLIDGDRPHGKLAFNGPLRVTRGTGQPSSAAEHVTAPNTGGKFTAKCAAASDQHSKNIP